MAALHAQARGRRAGGAPQLQFSSAAAEKKLIEDERLAKAYRASKRKRQQDLRDGPMGPQVRELDRFMKTMGLADAPELIARVEASAWIQEMDDDARHELLSLISKRITLTRERNGLEPYHDGVPGDPPRAFERIKGIMRCR